MATTSEQTVRLDRVRRRLDRWRQRRAHPRTPIPAPIWTAAVGLVPRHGLYQTARALHLDYGALKRHVEAAAPTRPASPPAFVELTIPPARAAAACVFEVEGPGGTLRVRVRVPPLPVSDLAALGRRLAGLEP